MVDLVAPVLSRLCLQSTGELESSKLSPLHVVNDNLDAGVKQSVKPTVIKVNVKFPGFVQNGVADIGKDDKLFTKVVATAHAHPFFVCGKVHL